MKTKMIIKLSIVLLILFMPTGMSAETTLPIDITFSPGGMGKSVESVTVTNLSQMDVDPQTLRGTDILRLGKAQLKGDVNGDGNVDISDIVAVINTIAGEITYKQSGDVNDDTNIDISDIVAIINIIAGGGTKSSSPRRVKSNVEPTYFTSEESPFTAAFIRSKAKATNIVEMDFKEGDILRFEGVSGEMRTIVVNAPKRSHSISFYFYPCKDVSGNTYPIIEAGGLLWMAEDLKAINNVKDVYFYENYESSQWASASNAKKTSSMAMIMSDDDVYYTYSAARLALPEGWSLPTLGELEAVSINLGGFEAACDKMKRAGDIYSFRDRRRTNPDSLQLRINPKGYVNKNGEVTDTDNGYILTGTREKHKAVYMTLSSSGGSVSDIITPNGLDSYAAVHVRGVRPAPSAYTDMMSQLYSNSATKSRMNMPKKAAEEESDDTNLYTGEVNPYTGTPYGQYYSVDHSTKQIVLDVTGQKCMYWSTTFSLDSKFYGTTFVNANDGSITQQKPEGDWILNDKGERWNRTRLKKMCQQKVADGTYRTLKVSYNVTVHDYQNDGSTNGYWMARDIEGKEGQLILEVYGNADSGFRTEKTVTLPGTYVMAEFDGFTEGHNHSSEDLRVNEFYMKRLNMLSADFNNDGVDDLLIGFCNNWKLYDGQDYETILAERTFMTDCVRACVGDLNENGNADVGFIYQENDQIEVRVLLDDVVNKLNGNQSQSINSISDYYASLPVGKAGVSSFLDIKFDDITNRGKSVLCLTVPNRIYSLNDQSTFYMLDIDEANKSEKMLKRTYTFKESQKNGLSSWDHDVTSTNTNSTIAVVHTRGMGATPDILLHNGLYRFEEADTLTQVNMGGVKEEGMLIDVAIPSDCVAVGRFTDDVEEGYEQLVYFGLRVANYSQSKYSSSAGDICYRGIYGVTELLTQNETNKYMKRKELNNGVIASLVWWTKDGDYHHGAVFPAFCATSYKDIDTRRYKFLSCNATMSEPRIKFALAAAPYWANVPTGYANAGEPYDYGDNGPSTEWVTSTSTTEATENSNGTSASLIFGYEQENKVSVFGVEIGKYGFEFETNIGYEWEKSYSEANTYTFESGCSAGRDNKVGLTMTPVWLYTYECIESNDPDNIGTTLVCGAPSYPRDLELSETDYMLLRGDREDIPDLSTVFTHTPGNPLTYPNSPDLIKSTGNILWSNNNKDQYSTTGSDGTKSFSITVDRENSTTTSNTFSMDMSLVGFVGAFNHTVKAGFGVGYSHTWSNTYSTGYGTTVTGSVPLPKSWGDVPIFDWNMCRYSVEVGGQEFPVVNYIVKNVRKSANGK